MTSSTEAAKVAGQNQVTDADLLRICQSFNPGQDLDLAKAVRAAVVKAVGMHTESAPVGYVTASALEAGLDYPDWRSEFFRTAEGLLDYFPTAEPVAVFTAPQASAEDVRKVHADAFIAGFICAGGDVEEAKKDCGHLVGHIGTTVTDVMVTSLASLAYQYVLTLNAAARYADSDKVEGIARRVTAKLEDDIRTIISSLDGRSS